MSKQLSQATIGIAKDLITTKIDEDRAKSKVEELKPLFRALEELDGATEKTNARALTGSRGSARASKRGLPSKGETQNEETPAEA